MNTIQQLRNTFISKICFFEDTNPSFNINKVPFDFVYAHSVHLAGKEQSFLVTTSQTEFGHEELFIQEITHESKPPTGPATVEPIHSEIIAVSTERDEFHTLSKLILVFETGEWYFYPAEIYETKQLEYVWRDEMVLVFRDRENALKFEQAAK